MRSNHWSLWRVGAVPVLVGLTAFAVGGMGTQLAAASGETCQGVGHGNVDKSDIWFTPEESPPPLTKIDQLDKVDPVPPNPVTVISDGAHVRKGFLVRGWLHVCVTAAALVGTDPAVDTFVGIVAFDDPDPNGKDDPTTNASWNVRAIHKTGTVPPGQDVSFGQFYQVVPNEDDDTTGFVLAPTLNKNDMDIDTGSHPKLPFNVHPDNPAATPLGHTDGPLTHDEDCGYNPDPNDLGSDPSELGGGQEPRPSSAEHPFREQDRNRCRAAGRPAPCSA
jgi:hypothetical protein